VRAKLNVPFPRTTDVASTVVHLPAVTDPDDPTGLEREGAFAYVIARSRQPLLATRRTA
jgi:hypothetical protein